MNLAFRQSYANKSALGFTEGALVKLDAFNPLSYSGTGTAWNDLSGNNHHYTLNGSPVFADGAFNFNANAKFASNANTYILDKDTPYTIEYMVKVNAWGGVLGMYQVRMSDGKCAFSWGSNIAAYAANGFVSGYNASCRTKSPNSLLTATWYHISVTYNGIYGGVDSLRTKVNNIDYGVALNNSTSVNTAVNQIGRALTGSTANSLLSVFNVYPFKLSDAQQTANFNFYKTRYNL